MAGAGREDDSAGEGGAVYLPGGAGVVRVSAGDGDGEQPVFSGRAV